MSRVNFRSPSGDAELRGSERAWLGGLVDDIACGALSLDSVSRIDRIRELIIPGHYMEKMSTTEVGWGPQWRSSFETALRVSLGGGVLAYQGKTIGSFSLLLNTACLLGNDQVKLAARIHGQCEIHGYVEGPNRAWLADIMQRGLDTGIYRTELPGRYRMGWEDVIALLRSRDDEPVAMSYSGCEAFPNPEVAGNAPPPMPDGWRPKGWTEQEWADVAEGDRSDYWNEGINERWYEQPPEAQWEQGMQAIRSGGNGLEISPDNWDTFRFTHELTVFDLYADDWRDRLKRALEKDSRD